MEKHCKLTTPQLDAWLASRNLSRQWLAERIHISKRTIDNWFHAGTIPDPQQELIPRIMAEHDDTAPDALSREEYLYAVQAMDRAQFRRFGEFQKESLSLAVWIILRDLWPEGTIERAEIDQAIYPERLGPYLERAMPKPSDELRLSFEEFREIDHAMHLAGYEDFDQFVIDIIRARVPGTTEPAPRAAEEGKGYGKE